MTLPTLLLGLILTPLLFQSSFAILGSVRVNGGGAAGAVRVSLLNDNYQTIRTILVDASGRFQFRGLGQGVYLVKVEATNSEYEEQTQRVEFQGSSRRKGAGAEEVHPVDFFLRRKMTQPQVPVLLEGDRLLFHISRGNIVHYALLAGPDALFVATGAHAYVSPDWYGLDDRVPTWSYVAVELNGAVRPLGEDALLRLLDDMSAHHEARLAPKPAWTRADMSPGRFDGLLKAITGFELQIVAWRGTAKIDQDKPADVRARVSEALAAAGEAEMAALYAPRRAE